MNHELTEAPGNTSANDVHVRRHLRWVAIAASVSLCIGVSACLFPYERNMGGGPNYTTYQPGYRIQSLPPGFRSETIGGTTYYYDHGNYYRRDGRGFVVVEAPRNSRYHDDYRRVRENREVNSHENQRIYDRNNAARRQGGFFRPFSAG